ncbi:hypothetical protein HPB50_003587 [Hyalomma asiaticum]|uniref:Uncharacterized protein n=1 Tax=Hyalomma asiaticum TaxID=266040 RepID=A0ACB7SUH3_HYAAI|nr:hypothetical protein HPB50_003587 [Hyalomma asiaticum]
MLQIRRGATGLLAVLGKALGDTSLRGARACGGNGASGTLVRHLELCEYVCVCVYVRARGRDCTACVVLWKRNCDWVNTGSSLREVESTRSRYADLLCLYATPT